MLKCRICKIKKPEIYFSARKNSKRGYRLECKDCRNKIIREDREERNKQLYNGKYREIPKQRKCPKCGKTKDASEFGYNRTNAHGLKCWCKICTTKERSQRYDIVYPYYKELLEKQNGKCAICGHADSNNIRTQRFAIDHNHKTEMVRGLLCTKCNHAIGMLGDNTDILEKALKYLKQPCTKIKYKRYWRPKNKERYKD